MESKLNQKLMALQQAICPITKDSTNPFFNSKYYDINALLDALKPVLNKVGLVVMQPLDGDKLKTILIDPDSGDKVESALNLIVNPDPQKMGSIITYFRRYMLASMLALQAEDDDANTATGKTPNTTNNHTKPTETTPMLPLKTTLILIKAEEARYIKELGNADEYKETLYAHRVTDINDITNPVLAHKLLTELRTHFINAKALFGKFAGKDKSNG